MRMTNKTIKKKRTEERKEDQKVPLTKNEKRHLAIYSALPKYSKIKAMIKEGVLNSEDIEIATPAIVIGAGFDRKQAANLFSLTIGLESHIREVRKIFREQINRARTRMGFSAIQRRYFENRIIFGSNEKRKINAKAAEVANVLKYLNEDQNKRLEYLMAGVDLSKVARRIFDNKDKYEAICQEVATGLQERNQLLILDMFKNSVWNAEAGIDRAEELAKIITRGYRRPYLKKMGKQEE